MYWFIGSVCWSSEYLVLCVSPTETSYDQLLSWIMSHYGFPDAKVNGSGAG